MERMHETNSDAPAIMRRRRRAARQSREKTPEPVARMGGVKPKYSDEENSSTTIDQSNRSNSSSTNRTSNDRAQKHRTASYSSGDGSRGTTSNVAYRNKILSRRDRNLSSAVVRSHSTPRSAESRAHLTNHDLVMLAGRRNSSGNLMTFLRQVKRSLSIPRYTINAALQFK